MVIKNIYHDRWTIEEYYKFLKRYTNLAKMNEQREVDINKTIASQIILSQVTYLVTNLCKNKDDEMIVNKSTLVEGIYRKLLYKFFNNSKFTKYFLLRFMKTYVTYVRSLKGRSFHHRAKRPNFMWYFKKHFIDVKSTET